MTRMAPARMRWIFHVPHGVAYAIENSRFGIWLAALLGFRWIDMDCHVTRDGVPVLGHWGTIYKDLFVLPGWFIAKYGKHARIEDVDWEDLKQLRTVQLAWRGRLRKRRFHYITVERAMVLIARTKRLGLALEAKGSEALKHPAAYDAIEDARGRAGLPKDRLLIMTLASIGGWHERLAAVKASTLDVPTIIQAHGSRKPADWATKSAVVDYQRGRWAA